MSESIRDRQLLHECVNALEHLLESSDLQLDCLEKSTREAASFAHSVLQKIRARLQEVYCVICGELLPGMSFTDTDRGQLVAYVHRACAEKAAQSAPPQQS